MGAGWRRHDHTTVANAKMLVITLALTATFAVAEVFDIFLFDSLAPRFRSPWLHG